VTTVNGTTIETTSLRSHWISETGTRYESQWFKAADGWQKRDGLRPVLNVEELRAYVGLGVHHLPEDRSVPAMTVQHGTEPGPVLYSKVHVAASVWYGHLVLTGEGVGRDERIITEVVRELTDDVPRYADMWRAPFVCNRERFAAPPSAPSA
jgi:hypothetical protein